MKIYYDTEFLEDGETIDLISIGMVREDGAELYCVNNDANWEAIYMHDWLRENVLPCLGDTVENTWSKLAIRNKVSDFIREAWELDADREVELWGYYSAYDHVALAQLFGRMLDLPPYVPMFTMDLQQELWSLRNTGFVKPEQSEGLHNALEDARWNRELDKAMLSV